jgi:polyketide cyclase/dehydrase/lipid transport protein
MMITSVPFTYSHTVEADVRADVVWSLYEDVTTWPLWDADAEWVTRDGEFATGTTGAMKFKGQEPWSYRLAKVEPGREFVDETPVGDIVVRVSHLLEPLASGQLRITYAVEIEGPDKQANEIGPLITADFPDTIAALVSLAKERSR